MARLSVLLVDDNQAFRESVEQMMADDPRLHLAGTASSGREALEMVARLKPDVVFMDLAMPDINGLQATRQLKAGIAPPYVIVMSFHGKKEYHVAARLAGADDFVNKDEFYTHYPRLIDWLVRQHSLPRGSSSKDS